MPAQHPDGGEPDLLRWLGEGWGEALAQVLEAMAGERPTAAWAPPGAEAAEAAGAAALRWQQEFDLETDAGAWATLAEDAWRSIGARALGASDAEETSDEDARGTCQEILAQSFSVLAQALEQRVGRAVVAAGREVEAVPAGVEGGSVQIGYPGGGPIRVELTYSPALLKALEQTEEGPEPAATRQQETALAPASATLDLLRDVELPVSISFGRAQMPLQDVLKLAAGSVIELDRAVSEPVSLIVNNMVVALGEVVVIEGNYGVRIQEIMCRERLLRSSGLG